MHLTEGRGTGFPIIYHAMKQNGSPEPVFETDEQCTYFLTVLPARINDKSDQAGDQAGDQVNKQIFNNIQELNTFLASKSNQAGDQAGNQAGNIIKEKLGDKTFIILNELLHEKTRKEIFASIGLSNHSKNRKKYLDPLMEYGWVEMLYPEKATSPNQKYRLTPLGVKLVKLLNIKKQ